MTALATSIVVGFLDRASSLAAFQFGLDELRNGSARRLVVAHATSVPVAVHYGPDARTARQLGNPPWAQVHELVLSLGADPKTTLCVVEHGRPAEVIARNADKAALIVLGPRRRSWWPFTDTAQQLRQLVEVPIHRVSPTLPTRLDAPVMTFGRPSSALAHSAPQERQT